MDIDSVEHPQARLAIRISLESELSHSEIMELKHDEVQGVGDGLNILASYHDTQHLSMKALVDYKTICDNIKGEIKPKQPIFLNKSTFRPYSKTWLSTRIRKLRDNE